MRRIIIYQTRSTKAMRVLSCLDTQQFAAIRWLQRASLWEELQEVEWFL